MGEYCKMKERDTGGPDDTEPLGHHKDYSFHSEKWEVFGGI